MSRALLSFEPLPDGDEESRVGRDVITQCATHENADTAERLLAFDAWLRDPSFGRRTLCPDDDSDPDDDPLRNPAESDDIGETLLVLRRSATERVRLSLRTYKGNRYLDLRLCEWSAKQRRWNQTTKGTSIRLHEAGQLASAIVVALFREKERRDRPPRHSGSMVLGLFRPVNDSKLGRKSG
ncbi:hypothetical protein [Sorangium sp. So ce145]|uniref:hypothetical protein n=1 Tax=Sorangium sp. So ce145 TaxID=3133285 RepID=UPI003F647736